MAEAFAQVVGRPDRRRIGMVSCKPRGAVASGATHGALPLDPIGAHRMARARQADGTAQHHVKLRFTPREGPP